MAMAALFMAGCASPPRSTQAKPQTPAVLSQTMAAAKPAPTARLTPLLAPIPASAWKEESFKWLGTPYLYGGSSRSGIDCSAFAVEIYRTVGGMQLPRTSQQQFLLGQPVHPADLKAGDLVFFRDNNDQIAHVGISLGGVDFIHASSRNGVIVSSLKETWYAEHVCGGKRIFP
jgi:cell wall-associated NlpC family hydrolase